MLVLARTDAGISLFAVEGDAAGLTRTPLATMDQTRKQARLEFADTPARLIESEGIGWDFVARVLDLAAVGLAAEQVGGAQKVLEMAVEYAKVRVQFGRPIGSFQAIKHKCADMLLEVESSKSAAYYGMWCAAEMNDELAVGGLAGEGVLLGGLLPRRGREHPDPRRHRLHLGAPGAPLLQAGEELRAAVRRPDLPPRAARPAHRHLSRFDHRLLVLGQLGRLRRPVLRRLHLALPPRTPDGTRPAADRPPVAASVASRRWSRAVTIVFAVIAGVAVFVIAAAVVGREAHRLDAVAPRSVYVLDEAVEYVAEHLPEDSQRRLTPADVEQLLVWHMRWLHAKGLAPADVVDHRQDITTPLVVAEDTVVGYLLGEADRSGLELLDDVDVVNVVDAHLAYFKAIGAVGPTASEV